MTTLIKCGQCRFFLAFDGQGNGECRHSPPTVTTGGFIKWPGMRASAIGCGQGRPLEQGEAAAVREKVLPEPAAYLAGKKRIK